MKYFILTVLVGVVINLNAQKIQKDSNIFDYKISKIDTSLVTKKLKGVWRSTDDKKYSIKFNENNYYEYYSHKCVTTSKYKIIITKADSVNKNGIKIELVVYDADRNFEIISLSGKVLTLVDDQSGGINSFKKLE